MSAPGELDLHLFGEGRHHRLWDLLGARPVEDGPGVEFAVWAPNAAAVSVVGDWNWWSPGADHLEPQGSSGIWWGSVAEAREGQRYKFVVRTPSGEHLERADPMATWCEHPPATASIVWRSRFEWSQDRDGSGGPDGWRAARAERNRGRLAVYELHAGSWRFGPDGRPLGYRDLAAPLAEHVSALGFTHVELMPLAAHPFGGSWGYQVGGYFAVDPRGGTPDDLRHLVEVLHQAGIGVIMDWVPAHFPRDEGLLGRFDGTALYEHADPRRGEHPDWGTYVFNHGRTEVRNFLVANALYWLDEFRLDGLRVDAVASMLYLDYSRAPGEWVPNVHGGREDLDAIAFLRTLNETVGAAEEGSLVIAEESTAWPGVTAMTCDGGLGFTHKQNLGWMHDTLGYLGHDPVHRRWHHDELTFPLHYAFDERWVLPLSHDEVVHGKGSWTSRFPGDRWQQLATLRSLLAWQWTSPGAPLVFMGAELGVDREWDHDDQLPWWLGDDPAHAGVARMVGELNRACAEHPALWRDDRDHRSFAWLDLADAEHSAVAFLRRTVDESVTGDVGAVVVGVANFTPVPRHGYRLGVPALGRWRELLNTDEARFGGSGVTNGGFDADPATPWQGQPASGLVTLPPLGLALFVAAPG